MSCRRQLLVKLARIAAARDSYAFRLLLPRARHRQDGIVGGHSLHRRTSPTEWPARSRSLAARKYLPAGTVVQGTVAGDRYYVLHNITPITYRYTGKQKSTLGKAWNWIALRWRIGWV